MNRTTQWLALALLLLTGLWWGQHTVRNRQRLRMQKERLKPLVDGINESSICFIELELPGEVVHLKRRLQQWVLPDHQGNPANPVYTKMLLETILNTPRGDVVTKDVGKHPQFHLDGQARVIKLFDCQENELGRLYVGKPIEGYRGTYVRLQGQPDVHLVMSTLIPVISRSTWLDRTIWHMEPNQLREIRVLASDFEWTLKSDDGQRWTMEGVQGTLRLNPSVVRHLAFMQARSLSFEDKIDAKRAISLQVRAQGVVLTLLCHKNSAGQWIGARPQSKVAYTLAESVILPLMEPLDIAHSALIESVDD